MNHYKSWSDLNQRLTGFLCDGLNGRVTYFLTRYHRVHNSYGRAAVRLDGRELACFSWIEMYRQERDLHEAWEETGVWDDRDPALKGKWDAAATYCEMDFLSAATAFLQMPITEALDSDNNIIRVLAAMDRRVGKRMLQKIRERGEYQGLPAWVRQFYGLRLGME